MDLVVLDTSVIIDYTRGHSRYFLDLLDSHKTGKIKLLLPVAALFELELGTSMEILEKREELLDSLSSLERLEVSEDVAILAGQSIRRGKIADAPLDAFIAATAVLSGAKLAILNRRHFRSFPGLTLYGN